jgi:hypothetical protein
MSRRKKNEYRMWPNGPTIVLPDDYHFDSATQEIVANDLSWRGDLMAWWKRCHPTTA